MHAHPIDQRPAAMQVATLPSGVHLRPIEPADLPALRRFVHGLSRDTAYKRLLSGRTPTEEELRQWSSVDHAREEAIVLIAAHAGELCIVGVARYAQEAAGEADFAIVLADAWQRLGLGRQLLAALISSAREHGLRRLTGITLTSNLSMLSLARGLGFHTTRLADAFTTSVALDIPLDRHATS